MAKYDVKFSCGHTATVQLFGKEADRQRKIKWYEESGLCPDCYRKQQEAEKQARDDMEAKKAEELGLVELTGTPKQISWANSIRTEQVLKINDYLSKLSQAEKKINETGENKEYLPKVNILRKYFEAAEQIIGSETSASRVIDRRNSNLFLLADYMQEIDGKITSGEKVPDDYLDEFGSELFVEILKKIYGEQEPEQKTVTLSPENNTSGTLVTVEYTDNYVTVESPKDYTIINIVKKNSYSWTGSAWKLQISLKTGKAEDRAAEIANKMLNAGYQVKVSTAIADAAVSGNYEPRCTRWITSHADDHDHVYVSWERGDDMYDTAKALTGSKWISGIGMRVPASSADEIEEFAETYGFKISDGARKKIAAYRKNVEIVAPKEGAKEEKIDNSENITDVLNSSRDVIEDLKDDD